MYVMQACYKVYLLFQNPRRSEPPGVMEIQLCRNVHPNSCRDSAPSIRILQNGVQHNIKGDPLLCVKCYEEQRVLYLYRHVIRFNVCYTHYQI